MPSPIFNPFTGKFDYVIGQNDDLTLQSLTLSGDLTVAGPITAASTSLTNLTSGRVVLAGASGQLQDSSQLAFDGDNLKISSTSHGYATVTTTSTSQTVADSFDKNVYKGGKYIVQASRADGNSHITELLVTHDDSSAIATQYGTIYTSHSLFTADVDILDSDVRLLVTSDSDASTTYNISKTLIEG